MKTILIIDDSPDILMTEEMVLSRAGYQVHTASSGRQGLTKFKSLPAVDLILLDYEMEPMSGLQFIEAFQAEEPERSKKTKIAFVTAHVNLPASSSVPRIPKMNDIKDFIRRVHDIAHS